MAFSGALSLRATAEFHCLTAPKKLLSSQKLAPELGLCHGALHTIRKLGTIRLRLAPALAKTH